MFQVSNIRPRFPRISDQENDLLDGLYEQMVNMAGHPNRPGEIDVIESTTADIDTVYIPQIREYKRRFLALIKHYSERVT